MSNLKKYVFNFGLLIMTLIVGVIYGIFIQKHRIFPYKFIRMAYYHLIDTAEIFLPRIKDNSYVPWSIGIYEGSTPFNLTDSKDIANPILTAKDIKNVKANSVADPFIIFTNKRYFMFFEVLNQKTRQGDIGYAESIDGMHWQYKKIVIDEKFHLSYPYIFEYDNNYYMIPESNQDLSVRLYKASSFPSKWEYIGNILSGYHYIDPSIFRYDDKWWLFVATVSNDILNLYYSNELQKGWKPHPMNPIVKFNKNISRPGGRVIIYNGKLYRFTQDDDPKYGIQVFAFEIIEISEKTYAEKMVSEKPVIGRTGKGWNAEGMHNIDLLQLKDKWIAAVDGRER